VKKDPKIFIRHIIESIELIEDYAKQLNCPQFKKDQVLQDAIIRRLEIIGEATKNIPSLFRIEHSHIPWKQMAGIRDILIHEYFDVDLDLTWQVVQKELPALKENLARLL
jgi:uncharacterized protein with HEPN domain